VLDISLGAVREKELRKTITEALDKKRLTPADADTLAGKLSWCAGNSFGRCGRTMLQPIYAQSEV